MEEWEEGGGEEEEGWEEEEWEEEEWQINNDQTSLFLSLLFQCVISLFKAQIYYFLFIFINET